MRTPNGFPLRERPPQSELQIVAAPGHLVLVGLETSSRILKVNPAVFVVSSIKRLTQALFGYLWILNYELILEIFFTVHGNL